MEYDKLILGVVLTVAFSWFFIKSVKRYGVSKSLLAIDIILGMIAGLYLIVTSLI